MGRNHPPSSGPHTSEKERVAAQVLAYNSKDLDAFCACFAQDIKIYDFPDQLLISGMDALRTRYTERFRRSGRLDAKILRREQYGSRVVDVEELKGDAFGRADATVIYEIENDRISKCWFVRSAEI